MDGIVVPTGCYMALVSGGSFQGMKQEPRTSDITICTHNCGDGGGGT